MSSPLAPHNVTTPLRTKTGREAAPLVRWRGSQRCQEVVWVSTIRIDIQSALASALGTKPYKLNLHPATIILLLSLLPVELRSIEML
ncbi:hypothetical protein LB506_006816 [Fusarium annulatum]|nr:hypothetical protein LB506_006816 [Fusarium annulatum]